jgi:hypothetical protein
MTDQELMQTIKTTYGAMLLSVCSSSSVPPSFIAGMIANESEGNANAKRFESAVLSSLWQVLLGRKAAYGSIGRADLVAYIADLATPALAMPTSLPGNALQNLDALASSWGLTQIMGYHVLEHGSPAAHHGDLELAEISIRSTIWLLAKFAAQFSLDLASDFEDLLRCWNTGRPDGKTFDPNYVSNGMTRKALYEGLP